MAIVPRDGSFTAKGKDGKLTFEIRTNLQGVVYKIELEGEGEGEVEFGGHGNVAVTRAMGTEPDESGWRPVAPKKKAKRKAKEKSAPSAPEVMFDPPPSPPIEEASADATSQEE